MSEHAKLALTSANFKVSQAILLAKENGDDTDTTKFT